MAAAPVPTPTPPAVPPAVATAAPADVPVPPAVPTAAPADVPQPPPAPTAADSFADLYDEERMSRCKQDLFWQWFPGDAGETCMAMMFYGYGEPQKLDWI
ncbi:unnamed protein product [Symbiodinium sp. CCMP2592]|nr:unnamed protein product [Symbiodinium sp. CCMP2592]